MVRPWGSHGGRPCATPRLRHPPPRTQVAVGGDGDERGILVLLAPRLVGAVVVAQEVERALVEQLHAQGPCGAREGEGGDTPWGLSCCLGTGGHWRWPTALHWAGTYSTLTNTYVLTHTHACTCSLLTHMFTLTCIHAHSRSMHRHACAHTQHAHVPTPITCTQPHAHTYSTPTHRHPRARTPRLHTPHMCTPALAGTRTPSSAHTSPGRNMHPHMCTPTPRSPAPPPTPAPLRHPSPFQL